MNERRATRIVPIDAQQPDAATIAEAAALLRAGGLVVFPTETVYGLGANALDAAAVRSIFAAKGRPAADPLIVHIAQLQELTRIAVPTATVELLAARFWPGPLTLVLPKTAAVPHEVTAGLPGVAVRMPAHSVALALIAAAGVPLAAPSANLFSRPSPTQARHVAADLAGRVDLILDGGPTAVGLESTVLDLQSDPPRVLRPGAITLDALRELLPNVVAQEISADAASDAALPAPGTHLKHYAPRAELLLFAGEPQLLINVMRRSVVERMALGQKVGLLLCDEDLAALKLGPASPAAPLGSCADLDGVARRLFAGLRDLDAAGVDVIVARTFPGSGIATAIRDRLRRAAEGHIVYV